MKRLLISILILTLPFMAMAENVTLPGVGGDYVDEYPMTNVVEEVLFLEVQFPNHPVISIKQEDVHRMNAHDLQALGSFIAIVRGMNWDAPGAENNVWEMGQKLLPEYFKRAGE